MEEKEINGEEIRCPKGKSSMYQRIWHLCLPEMRVRKNFSRHHVEQLKILCQLFDDWVNLSEDLQREGFFYECVGDKGQTRIIEHPAERIRQRVLSQIKNYTLLLELKINPGDGAPAMQGSDWE